MLHIDIHNTETGETIRVGTFSEFAEILTKEIGSVATVLFKPELRKKVIRALDAVVQKARDNAKLSR